MQFCLFFGKEKSAVVHLKYGSTRFFCLKYFNNYGEPLDYLPVFKLYNVIGFPFSYSITFTDYFNNKRFDLCYKKGKE